MFYVYILRSLKHSKLYYGHAEDVTIRVKRHNARREKYTKSGVPWELIHQESYMTRGEAMKREKHLKKLKNPKYILENVVGKFISGGSAAR